MLIVGSGCASDRWVRHRRQPDLPLAADLGLYSWQGPNASPRTEQLLRRNGVFDLSQDDLVAALHELIASPYAQSDPEHVFAISELSFLAGRQADQEHQDGQALDLYGVSVANAFAYLFDDRFRETRNPFDPQFRQASDLYNMALEGALRIVDRKGQLRPNTVHLISTNSQQYELHIKCRGPWRANDIKSLRFVSEYDVAGLVNHYRTYGLGVPLIAEHSDRPGNSPAEVYYAPGMALPVTAFLQVLHTDQPQENGRRVCVLELHDPLQHDSVVVNNRVVPLETDLSTPLAFSLNDPVFRHANGATGGLLNPAKNQVHQGLYLLEPYDPNKIPVLLVHGLWSSLVTWMEMFNDLRGVPEIRNNFQFWFYLYPSGQPLLLSASQLRQELRVARERIDPEHTNTRLDRMVIVGHSMGGLIARLQTMDSGEAFQRAFAELDPDNENLTESSAELLRQTLRFDAIDSVERVITIASPHAGSPFANEATRWLGRTLIQLPDIVNATRDQLATAVSDEEKSKFQIKTSIDSLSPESPVLEAMQQVMLNPNVQFHNIVGVVDHSAVVSKFARRGDGVVPIESARLPHAVSELVVEADHVTIHRQPQTVLEVQRILHQHLDQSVTGEVARLPKVHVNPATIGRQPE